MYYPSTLECTVGGVEQQVTAKLVTPKLVTQEYHIVKYIWNINPITGGGLWTSNYGGDVILHHPG